MGLFGIGGKAPKYQMVQAPKVMTGADAYSGAVNWGNQNFGNAMGARESALSDLSRGSDYYAGFQPTSFEQAMANQQFQNVWPDQQAFMMNQLAKSGMSYSPVAAATLGKAYGNTSMDIAQYLANQGNQRAQYSLSSRLGIDPMSMINPYANAGMNQSNEQANYDWQATKQNADAQYANDMAKYQQKMAGYKMMGQIVGGVGGAFIGGPQGAMMGSQMGGALMGGGNDMGSALYASQGMPRDWSSMFKTAQPATQSQILGYSTAAYR